MRTVASFVSLLLACAAAPAADFKIYAALTEDTRVELSDGAVWQMDKGDVFPVEAYKNTQKDIVLRLAGATFMIETARTRVLKPDEVITGIEAYRRNVRAYLDSTSKKIEKQLVASQEKKKPEPKPATPAPEKKPE